jgi:hypothetical protein
MACNLTQDRSCPLLFLFVQAAPDIYIVCVSYVLKYAAQYTDTGADRRRGMHAALLDLLARKYSLQ